MGTKVTKDQAERLKAFFTARFVFGSDVTSGGCETCGYGGTEAMSLEAVRDTIDDFVKSKENV